MFKTNSKCSKVENRPVTLNSLVFSDTKGNMVVKEEYLIAFDNYSSMELFIQDRYKYFKSVLNKELVMAPDNNETLKESEIKKVLELVCKFRGVNHLRAASRSRKDDYIECRRIAINICYDRHMQKTTIGKAYKLSHSNVLHHINKLNALCEVDRKYAIEYEKADEYVTSKLLTAQKNKKTLK